MAGITINGFVIYRLAEIISDLQADYRAEFGVNVQVGPKSVNGQKIAIIGERIASLWELAQAVYDASYLSSASGIQVDRIGALLGLPRNTGESTTAYRNRLQYTMRAPGRAAEALRSALFKVTGVTEVTIVENPTQLTIDSQPPHSVQAVVRGGDPEDIAQAIWDNKSDGTQPYGNQTPVVITDGAGGDHDILFSRATDVPIGIKFTYRLKPGADETAIRETLMSHVIDVNDSFADGRDVYPYEFEPGLIAGLSNLDAEIKLMPDGTYTEGSIAMGPVERATFSTDDIEWNPVT